MRAADEGLGMTEATTILAQLEYLFLREKAREKAERDWGWAQTGFASPPVQRDTEAVARSRDEPANVVSTESPSADPYVRGGWLEFTDEALAAKPEPEPLADDDPDYVINLYPGNRLWNVLKYVKINRISDLKERLASGTLHCLLRMPNFGRKSLIELTAALNAYDPAETVRRNAERAARNEHLAPPSEREVRE